MSEHAADTAYLNNEREMGNRNDRLAAEGAAICRSKWSGSGLYQSVHVEWCQSYIPDQEEGEKAALDQKLFVAALRLCSDSEADLNQ